MAVVRSVHCLTPSTSSVYPSALPSPAATTTSKVLERVRNVPSRGRAALVTFGAFLGAPGALAAVGALLIASGLEALGALSFFLSFVVLIVAVTVVLAFILRASTRISQAQRAVFEGDVETATREAALVVRTVFRSDYQTGALYTLAMAAERAGAFPEGAALFARVLDMIPAMAASGPARRARALATAHGAICFALAGDLSRANAMLRSCLDTLGQSGQTGAFDALLDDSYMGALGINSILVDLENRRDPRPLGVLASLLVAFFSGHHRQALDLYAQERAVLERNLCPHERALAERLQAEATRLLSAAGPHRSPGPLVAPTEDAGSAWAEAVLPPMTR